MTELWRYLDCTRQPDGSFTLDAHPLTTCYEGDHLGMCPPLEPRLLRAAPSSTCPCHPTVSRRPADQAWLCMLFLTFAVTTTTTFSAAMQDRGGENVDVKFTPIFLNITQSLSTSVMLVSIFFTTHVAAVLSVNGVAAALSSPPALAS